MTEASLTIDGLCGGYGDVTVVEDIAFAVLRSEATCITGRNGVGKTTLMRLITGSLKSQAGRIKIGTRDITQMPARQRLGLGMSYAPQERVVFDTLTVAENLFLHYPKRSLARYDALLKSFPRLGERLSQKAGTLSGGEKKILSFCRAMAEDSQLVLLDEPTEGVQPENIAEMAQAINQAKTKGRSFIVVEQNLSLVEQIADRAILLDHGNVVFSGPFGSGTRAQLQSLMVI
jgi:branched-chain amino acid transport system ATP-binding protein